MKTKLLFIPKLCMLFLLCIGIIFLYNLFTPRQIVEDVNGSKIIRIQYNPYFNQEMDARIEVTDYDEQGILTCLSRYKEQRTLGTANTADWIGGIKLEVTIVGKDYESKNILLGNKSVTYQSYGKPEYLILESDSLILELLQLIGVEP